jgi:hypothetical protein
MSKTTVTREDIQNLKASWRADPCWDIEDTEGFEDHKEELLQFRHDCERRWQEAREAKWAAKADEVGCAGNLKLGKYLTELESRLDGIDTDIHYVKYPTG